MESTKDLLESLVPAMVLGEILIGITGFTGPCSALDILDVILDSAGSCQKVKIYCVQGVPVMV